MKPTEGHNGALVKLYYAFIAVTIVLVFTLGIIVYGVWQNRATNMAVRESLEGHRIADRNRAAEEKAERDARAVRTASAVKEVADLTARQHEELIKAITTACQVRR